MRVKFFQTGFKCSSIENDEWHGPSPEGPGNHAAELFLDFDPVLPGWPGSQADQAISRPVETKLSAAGGVVVTTDDFRRLKKVIRARRLATSPGAYLHPLEQKLRNAAIVLPTQVAADVVTMNSTVRVLDRTTGQQVRLTLVYPHGDARDRSTVSVYSSLGTAILGHRAGNGVGPRLAAGSRRFTIDKILYQPEAQGDMHL
ncbi:MAG TPA: GreA/GreB family elongation factor [Tepidisphaeraceae bacterium]|nr:GreA/GreB family elongation factor [Tepidisphaeraceae bacterium]